jgi:VIT1/CCC1 family predicted Fe2+/Mn2+ transporter
MKKLSQKICVALVTGLLAIGTVSTAYAAENSAGVAEFINKSADSAKKALEDLQGGRADEAVVELKNVRQYSKEITGQAASVKLQRANQAIKETLRVLSEEKDNKKAIEALTPAVQGLKEIQEGKY